IIVLEHNQNKKSKRPEIWDNFNSDFRSEYLIEGDFMQVFGDEQLSQEVMAFLQQWDHAICSLEIQDIIQLCRPDIRLVDVSTEIKVIDAYHAYVVKLRPIIPEVICIYRQDMNILVNSDLALQFGYVQVNSAVIAPIFQLLWCRVSMCINKQH